LKQQIQNIIQQYLSLELGIRQQNELLGAAVEIDSTKITILFNCYLGKHENILCGCISAIIPSNYSVKISTKIIPHKIKNLVRGLPKVKNIIAVASGKGGVGKSTLASSLAISMQQMGAKVGLVDADIHGPSQPKIMGYKIGMGSTKSLEPIKLFGVETASISYFLTQESPIIWRGPMVSRALEQLVNDINWPELDYLFIDMPPGTGDIALTLAKKIPVTGAVIVTTPQDIALLDAKKAAQMFTTTNVPILGVVENMSYHICENCNHKSHIFGEKGGENLAVNNDYNFLGPVPLDRNIQIGCDAAVPPATIEKTANFYLDIAVKLGYHLSLMPKDHMRNFPGVKIT
jgi:ATP-binding protein involved in chromosome partitioning